MVDKWVRESVVCFVLHLIALLGHLLFLLLTVPSRANKNFPYHVRTTQIGIMEITDGVAGNNSLDAFGHHPYAPGGPPSPWPRVPVGLFTIAQSNCSVSTNGGSMMVRRQSMAVRRIYTPESLVLRHEEILPNANFMACMIRTEVQSNGRAHTTMPLRAGIENRNDSDVRIQSEEDENSENISDELEKRLQSTMPDQETNTLQQAHNPFIVTTTNTNSSNVVSDKQNDVESDVKSVNAKFIKDEKSGTVENNSMESDDRSSLNKKVEESPKYTANVYTSSATTSDGSDETDKTAPEESIVSNKELSRQSEAISAASFPRDDQLRSSIRKLPPLNIAEDSKNKAALSLQESKSNGVHQKPIFNRSESRVHFKL